MRQGRWVSYIFRYRNGERCENAGFIKVQKLCCRKGDEARIQIGLKLLKERACKCRVYLLYNNLVNPLTDIEFCAGERDTIMKRVEIPWDRPFDDVIPFDAYDGLFFVCDDGEVLAGLWNEHTLDIDAIKSNCNSKRSLYRAQPEGGVFVKYKDEPPKLDNENSSENKECAPKLANEKSQEMKDDDSELVNVKHEDENKLQYKINRDETEGNEKPGGEFAEKIKKAGKDNISSDTGQEIPYDGMRVCRHMLDTYPRLPLLADSQFIECVKIVPQDIGKLSMGNWKLGVNSFLSHGYYHYKYIMLGKVKFEKNEIYVIGVPGIFTNKEKYLANMFGFNVFIPARKTKFLSGNFGYWISEVSRE